MNFLPPSRPVPPIRLFGFPLEANEETEKKKTFSAVEDFTLLRWHSRTQKRVGRVKKATNSTTKQDFTGKAKQNIKAWLVSLSFDSSRAPTEWSAIFRNKDTCAPKAQLEFYTIGCIDLLPVLRKKTHRKMWQKVSNTRQHFLVDNSEVKDRLR